MLNHLISGIEDNDRQGRVRNAVLGFGYIAVEVEGVGTEVLYMQGAMEKKSRRAGAFS
jgi:hypothetical protein